MKKLTARQRALFSIRSRYEARRRHNYGKSNSKIAILIAQLKNSYNKNLKKLPQIPIVNCSDVRTFFINPPENFSISSNYKETMAFLMRLRVRSSGERQNMPRNAMSRWRDFFDLSRIKDIDPATGLVLAAELDWLRQRGAKFRSHDQTWHANVRSLFSDAGLFDLLNIERESASTKEPAGVERRMVKYITGSEPDGVRADHLRKACEEICGESFGPRVAVNSALCEAMTNSHHHAYPKRLAHWPDRPPATWWASCAWTPSTSTMHMMLYDIGVGIPETLPKSKHWSEAFPIFRRLDPEGTDAGLIEAALELRRTSTHIEGRGRGLYEMADWIDKTRSGFLRIISGRGMVTYMPGGKVRKEVLPVPFFGTLVEWEVQHG